METGRPKTEAIMLQASAFGLLTLLIVKNLKYSYERRKKTSFKKGYYCSC